MTLAWRGEGLVFESGGGLTFDADAAHGGIGAGPTPVEGLLASAGACAGMDVLSILHAKKQVVTAYRVEVEGAHRDTGDWPRPVERIEIRHLMRGEDLEESAVRRAVELTDEKYCFVVATLRPTAQVSMTYTIEPMEGENA